MRHVLRGGTCTECYKKTMNEGRDVPSCSLGIVLRQKLTALKHDAQVQLSACVPLGGGKPVKSHSLCEVFCNALTEMKLGAQVVLSIRMSLRRRKAVPSQSLCPVLRNNYSMLEKTSKFELSVCMALRCCEAVPSRSLCYILRYDNTFTVATCDHELAEAAARSRALPPKRQPFPLIFGNTSAYNEAAAESALAVRAARGCPSCSQLERALPIPGNVRFAFNQKVRQEGVRRRVLQQRRLRPALGRVAEALAAVQALPLIEHHLQDSSTRGHGAATKRMSRDAAGA